MLGILLTESEQNILQETSLIENALATDFSNIINIIFPLAIFILIISVMLKVIIFVRDGDSYGMESILPILVTIPALIGIKLIFSRMTNILDDTENTIDSLSNKTEVPKITEPPVEISHVSLLETSWFIPIIVIFAVLVLILICIIVYIKISGIDINDSIYINYLRKLSLNYNEEFIERLRLDYNLSSKNLEFLNSCIFKQEESENKWYEQIKEKINLSYDDSNKLLFCTEIYNILSNKHLIFEYLEKNKDKNFVENIQYRIHSSSFSKIDDYFRIKNKFFSTELTFYLLSVKEFDFEELYKEISSGSRINLLYRLAPIVAEEVEFQKKLATTGDIEEAIHLYLYNNDYESHTTIVKNLLYLNNYNEDLEKDLSSPLTKEFSDLMGRSYVK